MLVYFSEFRDSRFAVRGSTAVRDSRRASI
jgi:hypothetical protein